MKWVRQFDEGLARGEAAVATAFLLGMIVAAAAQALFRNLTHLDLLWANAVLDRLSWVDPFLQKGTLWLGFLGASLATRDKRHIAVDALPRFLPARARLILRAVTSLGASAVSFFLARAFWAAVLVNAEERPASYEIFGAHGPVHVCDASTVDLAAAHASTPSLVCGVRAALSAIGVPVETGGAALQLVVPVMLVIIAARLLAIGIGSLVAAIHGRVTDERP